MSVVQDVMPYRAILTHFSQRYPRMEAEIDWQPLESSGKKSEMRDETQEGNSKDFDPTTTTKVESMDSVVDGQRGVVRPIIAFDGLVLNLRDLARLDLEVCVPLIRELVNLESETKKIGEDVTVEGLGPNAADFSTSSIGDNKEE